EFRRVLFRSEVINGFATLLMAAQHLFVKMASFFHEFQQGLVQFFLAYFAGAGLFFWYFHTGLLGQLFHRFGKADTIKFHYEFQRRTGRATAKAIIKLL